MTITVPMTAEILPDTKKKLRSKKLHLCRFPELLLQDFERQIAAKLGFKNKKKLKLALYSHQKEGFPKALNGVNLFVRTGTNSGKTYLALACLYWCLLQGLVGVYLVPTKRLLADKQREILQFFNVPSRLGDQGAEVCVVTLSGETRPPKEVFREYQHRLIILATYEAFRSFCFGVQGWQYFRKRRVFGTVVIDEAHYMGNKERGMGLQTLVLKLKEDYEPPPQFCFLSGTFSRSDAKWWCDELGCVLLEEPLNKSPQKFKYSELAISYREVMEEEEVQKTPLEHVKIAKLVERLQEYLEDHQKVPRKILIFCYARWLAREMLKELAQDLTDEAGDPLCWYRLIHAGLADSDQDAIFEEFKRRPSRHKILVSSPLLEAGINVTGINLVVIMDPEHFDPSDLAQMCGRLREEDGEVLFVVTEEFRAKIEAKFELEDDYIVRFNLEYLFGELPHTDLGRLILERLYWHPQSETQLCEELGRMSPNPAYLQALAYLLNLKRVLQRLVHNQFVRKIGGKYALTFMGDAIAETGIGTEVAKEGLLLLRTWIGDLAPSSLLDPNTYLAKSDLFSYACIEFIANQVAFQVTRYIPDPKHRVQQRAEIEQFFQAYNHNNPVAIQDARTKHKIDPGDEEVYRRTAIWFASSLLALYNAYQLHCAPQPPDAHSYYDRIRPAPAQRSKKDHLINKRLRQQVRRFQSERSRKSRRPERRPRGTYSPYARYKAKVEAILRGKGPQGATIQEIRQAFTPDLSPSHSCIYATLHGPLQRKVSRTLEHAGRSQRPSYRYWLGGYQLRQRGVPQWCADCIHFRMKKAGYGPQTTTKTHCVQGQPCLTHFQETCANFQKRTRKFLIYYPQHFISPRDGKIHCPYCGQAGTVQIPTFQKMIRCKACKILLKQVRKGRYQGRVDAPIPENLEGASVISIERYKRAIHLKQGETLTVEDPTKVGIAMVEIRGRRLLGAFQHANEKYFLDQVAEVFLEGGTIASGRVVLIRHGIRIWPNLRSEKAMDQALDQEMRASELRDALWNLTPSKVVEKGAEFVIAKMRSNINYTLALGQLNPDYKFPLTFLQFDQIAQIYLLLSQQPKTGDLIPYLRSREGNAELAAWEMIKQSLPSKYWFSSRKIERAAWSDLISGVGALDPFNSVLNYLYFKLKLRIKAALAGAGFDQHYPGIGFLHRRHQKPPVIEHENNEALIYDFMDSYRPPFRYYLLLTYHPNKDQLASTLLRYNTPLEQWCLTNSFSKQDFLVTSRGKDRPIYKLSPSGRAKGDQLFALIMENYFRYRNELLPLKEVMQQEAMGFAAFLLGQEGTHEVFTVLENQLVTIYFKDLESILSAGMMHLREPQTPPVALTMPQPAPRWRRTLQNVILITHTDGDGFLCALHLLTKYYHWHHPTRGKVQLVTTGRAYLRTLLRTTLTQDLWQAPDAQNTVIVADFAFKPQYRKELQDLQSAYKKKQLVQETLPPLQFLWYDHHQLDQALHPKQLKDQLGLEVHCDPTVKHTFHLIREELLEELARYDQILKHPAVVGALGVISLFFYLIKITKYKRKAAFKKHLEPLGNLKPYFSFFGALLTLVGCKALRNAKEKADLHKTRRYCPSAQLQRLETAFQEVSQAPFKRRIQAFWNALDFRMRLAEKHPWDFFNQLMPTRSQFLRKKWDVAYLSTWIEKFKAINSGDQKSPHRTWLNFFKAVFTPPKVKQKPEEAPPAEVTYDLPALLYYGKLHETPMDLLFAALVFYEPFDLDKVNDLVKQQLGGVADFNLCYLIASHLVVLRSNREHLDFSEIAKNQNVVGYHQGAVSIESLLQRAYGIFWGSIAPLYFYRFLPFGYLIQKLAQSPSPKGVLQLPPDPVVQLQGTQSQKGVWEKEPSEAETDEIEIQFAKDVSLFLPRGNLTLFFASNERVLEDFLPYLVYKYLRKTMRSSASYNANFLFIDTLQDRLNLNRIIDLVKFREPIDLLLNRIISVKVPSLKGFTTFIKEDLEAIIQPEALAASVVVITVPFQLIKDHWKAHDQEPRKDSGLYFTGADLIGDLKAIARRTGATFILTAEHILYDRATEVVFPYIQVSAQMQFPYQLYVTSSPREFTIKTTIAKGDIEYLAEKNATQIPRPRVRRKPVSDDFLAKLCGLPKELFPDQKALTARLRQEPESWVETPIKLEAQSTEGTGEPTSIESKVEMQEPGYKDLEKLERPPFLERTDYGMEYLVWLFKENAGYIANVHNLLAVSDLDRTFDLVKWPDGTYNIYNSKIDLRESPPLKKLGGETRGRGPFEGIGMRFVPGNPHVLPFDRFKRYLKGHFLTYEQLETYLQQTLDEIPAWEAEERESSSPDARVQYEGMIEELVQEIFPIFESFPPNITIQDIRERWNAVGQKWRLLFDRDTTANITSSIVSDIEFVGADESSAEDIQDSIRGGLRKGLRSFPTNSSNE